MTTGAPRSGSSIARFISWQRDFNGVSDDRLRSQAAVLAGIETLVGGSADSCTSQQFAAYLEGLSASGLAPNTVRKQANMARPFFKWAWREGLIDADRAMRLAEVRNPAGSTGMSKPNPYSRREIEQLWRDLDTTYPRTTDGMLRRWQRGTSAWPRVWRHAAGLQAEAIFLLALHAGMRKDEIYRSEIDDIHFDLEYVVVHGAAKGASGGDYRVREVPMTEDLRAAMCRWLEFRTLLKLTHDRPWLVLNPRAHPNSTIPGLLFDPISERGMARVAGDLGKGYQLQRLRHTCATEWLRAGVKLELVSQLLGHATISQTLAYAKIVPDDVGRATRQAESNFSRATTRKAAA
jgi:integrase